jgi:hypothetical protein
MSDTLEKIVEQYYQLNADLDPASIDEIAKLNNISPSGLLAPAKLIVLPDSASAGMCSALDYEAATLVAELNTKGNDPLKQILSTERGEELLAALEFTEALDAQGETKAFFGGAMGASAGLYEQFIKEHDNYQRRLAQYATVPSRERRLLKREISRTAKKIQELFRKIVAQKVHFRKNARPQKLKMLPRSAMASVRERGTKSVYLQDSADIRRVRWVMRGAKVLGAGALLLDVGMAAKKIKHAYETGDNTTRVAFKEIGGITGEIAFASAAAFGTGVVISGVAALLPFALIPGLGLIIIIGAGAIGAVGGNILGKKLGDALYENFVNDSSNAFGPDSLKAL